MRWDQAPRTHRVARQAVGRKQRSPSEGQKEMKTTTHDGSAAFLIPLSQQELQETEKFSRQAAQAAKDLTRAEAEIELLQNLLRDKEEQVSAGTLTPSPYRSYISSRETILLEVQSVVIQHFVLYHVSGRVQFKYKE